MCVRVFEVLVTGVSKHCGNTLPCVEVEDTDVFIRAAGGNVLPGWVELNLPRQKTSVVNMLYTKEGKGTWSVDSRGKCYPEQAAILTQ